MQQGPGVTPTCLVLLVTAAPLVPTEDAGVVGAQQATVVDAHLPQRRQPLVQFIHTLPGHGSTDLSLKGSPPSGSPPPWSHCATQSDRTLPAHSAAPSGLGKAALSPDGQTQPMPGTWLGEQRMDQILPTTGTPAFTCPWQSTT